MAVVSLGNVQYPQVVIPISTQLSAPITTEGMSLCGIFIPAAFTGTVLTFLAATSLDGTYQPISNENGLVSYDVAAGQYIAINPQDFYGVQFLQIKSGSSEAAARTLICSMKGI